MDLSSRELAFLALQPADGAFLTVHSCLSQELWHSTVLCHFEHLKVGLVLLGLLVDVRLEPGNSLESCRSFHLQAGAIMGR
jgi:hypothetical protein